ncbi:unnamed protein product, partial [Urochloa humidicola]
PPPSSSASTNRCRTSPSRARRRIPPPHARATGLFLAPSRSVPMGFLQNTFSLLIGTGCGIYVAQNYKVPIIKDLIRDMMVKFKVLEESYKKPGDGKDKDSK